MAPDPSQEDIQQVIEVIGCDRDQAFRYLKVKNNDVMQAITAILDQEDISKAEKSLNWTEQDFNADRDGNVSFGGQDTSFNGPDLHPLGAPTRGSTPVPSLQQTGSADDEDAAMQQAIANSQQDAGFGRQEMGYISASKPSANFGPATRSDYDPSRWAITLPGQEVMPDLEPADRVNLKGQPRCLRPLPSHDYLPNLLSILHSIPLARKALLMPHNTRSSYGQDPEWWKGHTIKMPRIVSTADLSSVEPASTESDDMVAEMQRLIALLDASSRSYGSVDSLLRLDAVNNVTSDIPGQGLVDRVLHAWELSATHFDPDHASDAQIFRSVMGTNDSEGLATPYMRLIPLKIGFSHSDLPVTLTEAMNELLWDLEDPDDNDNYIEHPAEVLCMHVARDDKNIPRAGLVVPPFFYIDQYLKENVGETMGLRKEIAFAKQRLTNLDAARLKLESFQRGESRGRVDSSVLLSHSIGHFSGQNKQAMLEERLLNGADVDVDLPSPSDYDEQVVERLNAVYAGIRAKLDVLNEESHKAQQLLSRLWQSTTESIPADSLKHRYWLRGVATKSSVTYILRPRDQDAAASNAMVEDDEAPEGMQWWRIEYDENGSKLSKTLAAQDDVIRAVELEDKEALVVYASDAAIAPQSNDDLPVELFDFVRNDDEHFNAELEWSTHGASGTLNVSPLEHDQRRSSIDSTTVNFDDDTGLPPYDDYQDLPAHEITLDGVEPETGTEMEMVEDSDEPLTMGAWRRKGSDATMIDVGHSHSSVTQDRGHGSSSMDADDLIDI